MIGLQSIEMEDLVATFQGKRLVILGDVMLDRYHWGTVSRISPEAPVPVVRLQSTTLAAGGAANVAANAVGLGASVRLFGVIGDDDEGTVLAREIGRAGIPVSDLRAVSGRRTIVKTRIVAHGQHVVRLDQEDSDALEPSAEQELSLALESALEDADVAIVSDYGKGLLSRDLLARLITSCRRAGKPVLVDPKGKDYTKYSGAMMITPNQKEMRDAAGLEDSAALDPSALEMVAALGLDALLVTLGEAGMVLYEREGTRSAFSAQARQVFDVTGAGDTVIAALGTAIAAGTDLRMAVEFANVAAGIVVEHVGTTRISSELIAKYLREHD